MTAASPNNGAGYATTAEPTSSTSEFNGREFHIWSTLASVRTMTLVEVKAVTNNGGVVPVGFVDVLPLVNQIDGAGNAVPHTTIHRVPYTRVQGGENAVIIDPQVGDIGWAGFADRDISSVVANRGQANPGSWRRFDLSDAIYLGGVLNGTPTQYIAFSSSGIAVYSPNDITIQAGGNITANAQGNISATAGGNMSAIVKGTTTINSTGDATIETAGNATITAGGDIDLTGANASISTSGGDMAVTTTGTLTINAPTINLN